MSLTSIEQCLVANHGLTRGFKNWFSAGCAADQHGTRRCAAPNRLRSIRQVLLSFVTEKAIDEDFITSKDFVSNELSHKAIDCGLV